MMMMRPLHILAFMLAATARAAVDGVSPSRATREQVAVDVDGAAAPVVDDAAVDQDALEAELLKETIEAGRGDRDEQGVRDQWAAKSGINAKEDIRRPISKKVREMMRDNNLKCDGCSHKEAVALVNDFVKQEQVRIAAAGAAVALRGKTAAVGRSGRSGRCLDASREASTSTRAAEGR